MAVTCGLLVVLETKEGKGAELGAFLEAGRDIAAAEQGTVSWYAFKMNDTRFGVFDTFESEVARQAHLDGEIPKALAQVGPDLLAKEPDIRRVDLVAVK
jgi:quinol monooxygenase YgiN